ncbi:MAG TPA: serine/threonine-protein kinase, partial [Planctomycetota bacterium]|nr:serine/threonine-protein kinase [Planctomycetota bacterium]
MTEETAAGRGSPEPTLFERLRAQYGPGIDPGVTLEPQGADATPADFASEVLSRLSSRPGAAARYLIQGEVARGGQGAILRVWDEELRRHLAMKVTLGKVSRPDTGAPTSPVDARTVGRFLEEAQVTGQLDHPGIVPVHELGLDSQGRVFFTMKLVKGEDLRAVFARVHAGEPGWTVTRALSLLLKVCEAMSYAHAKRVIHRDLKPGNVMVGSYGEVYVMDWGLARVLDRKDDKDVRVAPQAASLEGDVHSELRERAASDPDSPLLTRDGDVLGTPAYMPPEQAAGQLERMGPPSDVYALGAMLYHLLTGHAPYRTPAARVDNFAILRRVQEGPPDSVSRLAPDAPAELVAICEKAMAREPTARYADMSTLAEDLRAYLERRVVEAYETGAVAELRKWVVRNKPLAGALAAGVLLLAGGLTTSLVFERLATQKTN